MQNYELYVLIAVFAMLTVVIVWIGAKSIGDMRRQKRERARRREEWQQRLRSQHPQ